jgi:hypothetical protein
VRCNPLLIEALTGRDRFLLNMGVAKGFDYVPKISSVYV